MIGMFGFNKYLVVSFQEKDYLAPSLDFFGVKILDSHRQKLPGSPADQDNVEHQRNCKINFSNINEEKQSKQCGDRRSSSQTYPVGHAQRQMIVIYDRFF
jgi:hypothetical protein